MVRYRSRRPAPRRNRASFVAPLVAFLIVASFGILFAGCTPAPSKPAPTASGANANDLTFTEQDIARFQRLASQGLGTSSGSTATSSSLAPLGTAGSGTQVPPVLDLSMVKQYQALRTSAAVDQGNVYRVTNSFLNVRSTPSVSGKYLGRFNRGDAVTVLEFVNAGWAKVQMQDGKTGYVAITYLGRLTTDDRLSDEKKAYANLYYVHFAHVNVRQKADPKSLKLGEIPNLTFLHPLSIDKGWARISFQGKEAYVSMDYLVAFLPTFIVRQDKFTLPILQFDVSQSDVLKNLPGQVQSLKQAGLTFLRMSDLRQIVIQEGALSSHAVVLAIEGVTAENIRQVSDDLNAAGVSATFFIQTKNVGISGITQKTLLTVIANGFDVQSGGHSGEDLRALTDAQVTLEVQESRKLLEDMTAKPVFVIDYPQGGVNDRVAQVASDAGYLFGIGNIPDKQVNRSQFLSMPSYAVTGTMSADDILHLIK